MGRRTATIIALTGLAIAGLACRPGIPAPSVPPDVSVQLRETAVPAHTTTIQVQVEQVVVLTETVVVSFTVSTAGTQALLFDMPELDGKQPTPDSLEAAHFALLDLATRGQAQASLEFPKPATEPPWALVFNPLHEPTDYVAPRVEVMVR